MTPTLLICQNGHLWRAQGAGQESCPSCGTIGRSLEVSASELFTGQTLTVTLGDLPPPPQLPSGPTLPGYRILGELGRGGMGVVYRAEQVGLNRPVAVKMVLAGQHAGEEERSRFRREAEAVARLCHPNIIQVYDFGERDGCPYFAMELVEGGSLAHRLDGTPQPGRVAAELVETLARATEAAHQAGVVHRDLKPANVLIAPDGTPKITDFGLAKQVGKPTGDTASGAILGTPSYMAPEQASGKSKRVGPEADVYSLGAILYELLTGRPPFRAETLMDTLTQVMERDPVPPRLLNPRVGRDLETICLKCLQKDPAARYPTAAALAADLVRYRAGEPVQASSLNLIDRLTKALESDRYGREFASWGPMLVIFGVLIMVGHLATFVLLSVPTLYPYAWICRPVQFTVMGLVFWFHRPQRLWPTSLVERQLWSIWVGYLVTFAVARLVMLTLLTLGVLRLGENSPDHWRELLSYPMSAVLSGLAFFIMGASYWGWCYAMGLAFCGLALVMPLWMELAPLELGLVWGVSLIALGLHQRHLCKQEAAPRS